MSSIVMLEALCAELQGSTPSQKAIARARELCVDLILKGSTDVVLKVSVTCAIC